MKKKAAVYTIFCLIIWEYAIFASESMQVELHDGTIIVGKIISFQDDCYTIQSDTLGTVNINESKIRIIRSISGAENTAGGLKQPNPSINSDVEDLTKQMMIDEQIMNMIFSLQNDPDFQKILNDPALLNAVNSGDFATLMSNPAFMNLLKNKKVQEIKKRMIQE